MHSNKLKHKNLSRFKIVVNRCTGDHCSNETSIDNWTASKYIKLLVLNYQLD